MNCPLPRIIAHRGFSAAAPENTLAAFKQALELGVDGVEFDVRFSRDLEVMIVHDEKLNRTTNGRGRIRELDRREIQAFDAGGWFSPEFRGERIPTLRDLIALVRPWRPELVLEIKSDSKIPADYVDRILDPFPHDWLRDLIILSFDHSLLSPFRRSGAPIRCGALVNHRGDAVAETLEAGAQILALRRDLASQERIQRAQKAGLEVMVWTVDREHEIRRFCDWHVDAIITNRPDRALRLAKNGD